MEENKSASSFETPPPEPPSLQNRARLKKFVIVAIIVVIALLPFVVAMFRKDAAPSNATKEATSGDAAADLYAALGNAAKQQKLHVAMYRVTYANQKDADAAQNPGAIASSVSEVDATAGKYRSVFAHNLLQDDKSFSVGRCLDGDTYNEAYNTNINKEPRATSLKNIASHLAVAPQGHVYKIDQPLVFISCPHLGLMPSAPPLAVSRLSDGVFPVTFSEQQAAKWVTKLKQANLFTITDDGHVEKDGKVLHKISFSPKNDSQAVNKKLYDIFYETGEIDKIETEHPDAEWQYEFLSINPVNSGSVGGFYLIDEKRALPVYSELYGTNPDLKTGESPAASHNVARTKQTYTYPSELTIDINTQLDFLE